MLAARLPGILPPLEPAEALELGTIQSVTGGLRGGGLSRERPFRDPQHSASLAALVGGGPRARPGEISLAHHGVPFLDELAEFNDIMEQTDPSLAGSRRRVVLDQPEGGFRPPPSVCSL